MLYIEEFQSWLANEGKDKKTVSAYQHTMTMFSRWWEQQSGEGFEPENITSLDLHDWRAYLQTARKYAPATINRHIAALKTYWAFLLDTSRATVDPTRKVKTRRPSMLNEAPRWLTRKEQARFLHEIEKEKNVRKHLRDLAMVQCMLQAGCRAAEVTGFDIDDIDFKHLTLTIRRGKRGKTRVALVNRDLAGALTEWLEVRQQIEALDGALFLSERNQRITVRALQHMVHQIFGKIGTVDGSCHSFRHSFCKNLIDGGQPLNVVAKLAGHESIESTMRYVLPGERDLRNAVESISSTR